MTVLFHLLFDPLTFIEKFGSASQPWPNTVAYSPCCGRAFIYSPEDSRIRHPYRVRQGAIHLDCPRSPGIVSEGDEAVQIAHIGDK